MKRSKGRTPPFEILVSVERRAIPPPADPMTEVLEVERIMNGKKSVYLLHRGEAYRLQVTRQGRPSSDQIEPFAVTKQATRA